MRQFHFIDRLVIHFDQGLRTLSFPATSERSNPALMCNNSNLTEHQRKHSAALMRINHAGELSAQGLYQGQSLTAQLFLVRQKMAQSALEEIDHLAWCEERLVELQSHTSYLAPLWYFGSFFIGAAAGFMGDHFSLGFVIETENQVVAHLQRHLEQLSKDDQKSRAILSQMKEDEAHHATLALEAGGTKLPSPIQTLMHYCSKIMTTTAYWI